MGLFRRCIRKVYDVGGSSPILSERQTTKNVVHDGVEIQQVIVENVDVSKSIDAASMPSAAEWDLDEQLKAGYKPEQLSVKGMLPVDKEDMEFRTIQAFNSLQSQIDEIKENASNVENDVQS